MNTITIIWHILLVILSLSGILVLVWVLTKSRPMEDSPDWYGIFLIVSCLFSAIYNSMCAMGML